MIVRSINIDVYCSPECEFGFYKDGSTCEDCPADTFKAQIGDAVSCTLCPSNSTTRGATAQTRNTCCGYQLKLVLITRLSHSRSIYSVVPFGNLFH